MLNEPVAVTMLVIDALNALQIPYFIGGSLASSVHGVIRTTMDVDLVADLDLEHVEPLVQMLGQAFYVDAEAIKEAIRLRRSFNAIHLATMFKVDVFVCKQRPYDQAQLERRLLQTLATDPEQVAIVTRGESGCVGSAKEGVFELPAFAVDVVDTTGCGDTFHGAFALALARGQPVVSAARFASGAAALCATQLGGRAGIPTALQLEQFLTKKES